MQAFPDETGTSLKVISSVTPNFRKIRNCKVLEVPLPDFGDAISRLIKKSFGRIVFVKDLSMAEVNMPMDDQV